MKVKRALISVSDKEGIEDFARELHEMGVEILSTGGTAKLLLSASIPVQMVSDWTGFPEILDGRVKKNYRVRFMSLAPPTDEVLN